MATATVNFRPLTDRVLIQPDAVTNVTPGGIHLPDQAKNKPRTGTVIAAGPGKPRVIDDSDPTLDDTIPRYPMEVAVGDRVYFPNYTGNPIELPGQPELIVMRQDDVLGVLDSDV